MKSATFFDRADLVDVALGTSPANLVIKGGILVNVGTRETYKADVSIRGRRIAAVGEQVDYTMGDGTKVVNLKNRYLVPGFIDAHRHLESSQLSVTELAKVIVPRGTTALVEDPHEIANVLGLDGIKLLFEEAKTTPLKLFLRVPGQVPAVPGFETTGGKIKFSETKELLRKPDSVCLAGDVNPMLILNKQRSHLRKIQYTIRLGKTVAGQAPGLTDRQLNAFVAAGPEDSHVAMSAEEAIRKMRLGLKAILTPRPHLFEPSDFAQLAQMLEKMNIDTSRILFCIDDKMVNLLVEEGDMDHVIRLAIREGFDPISAFQMATINVADHYKLRDLGSIAPGKVADIAVLDNLESVKARMVIADGKIVAEEGKLIVQPRRFRYPGWAKRTIHLPRKVEPTDFEFRVRTKTNRVKVRAIGVGIPKKEIIEELSVKDDVVIPSEERDILSLAVLERHRGTGRIGKAFIKGTGIKQGAMASSYCHDHHNIVAVGTSNEGMALCVNRLTEIGGGFAAAEGGQTLLGDVRLPIAGMISDDHFEIVAKKLDKLETLIFERLRCVLKPSPFFWLSVIPLPNIPALGLTDRGLFDARTFRIVNSIIID